jgi:hypothetical protein
MAAWISLQASRAVRQSREVRQQSRALCWLGQDTVKQSRQTLARAAQLRLHAAQQRLPAVPTGNRQYRDTVTEVLASLLFSDALCLLLDQSASGTFLDVQGLDDATENLYPILVNLPIMLPN